MDEMRIFLLRNRLLDRRNEILGRIHRLEAGLHELGERETEIEEEAQKSSISDLYERLDEAGKNEIRNIDRALAGISSGDYGICESCGDDIHFKRLEAIPWALLCVDCARERENAARSISGRESLSPGIGFPVAPRAEPSGRGVDAVYEYLRKDGRVDAEDLILDEIDGRLTLDGGLGDGLQHQVLLQILTRVFGYASIVDRLEVGERGAEEKQSPISGILREMSSGDSAMEGRSGFD